MITAEQAIKEGIAREVAQKISAVNGLNESLLSYSKRFAELIAEGADATTVAHWASVIAQEAKQMVEFANMAKGMALVGWQVERMGE